MTTRSHRNADFEASMRLMWTGSVMIVLGVAFFVIGLLALRAYLVPIGAGVGAIAGLGLLLVKRGMRRQRNIHPF